MTVAEKSLLQTNGNKKAALPTEEIEKINIKEFTWGEVAQTTYTCMSKCKNDKIKFKKKNSPNTGYKPETAYF
jgi:hypothetical protein